MKTTSKPQTFVLTITDLRFQKHKSIKHQIIHMMKPRTKTYSDNNYTTIKFLDELRHNRVFVGVERSIEKICLLVWFYVFLWASVCKDFCNYHLDLIRQIGTLFYFHWLLLCMPQFFLMKVWVLVEKKKRQPYNYMTS